MKWMAAVLLAGVCSAAVGQGAGNDAKSVEKRMRAVTSFDLVVRAPYAETAVLFGPEGERPWAGKHWDPQFIYPAPGRDEEGAVFTIAHGELNAVWVIAQHDVDARHFQYVYFLPGLLVTTIDVRFTPVDAGTTKVHVTYARTAVSAEGDAHVATMSEGDKKAGGEWQSAIDAYLATRAGK
jgi:hypothetical protein